MLPVKRWQQIVDLLQDHGSLSVNELVKLLDYSPATIRRDLISMEKENLLKRCYGGATLDIDPEDEESMNIKQYKNISEKRTIASFAASLIKENDTVYIDAGTTTLALIENITTRNIIVVTNGIEQAHSLNRKNIPTIILGGPVKQGTMAITGNEAIRMLDFMNFNIAFLGANGVHKQRGFSTPKANEGEIKSKVFEKCDNVYVLADSSKLNTHYFVSFAKLEDATLITDKRIDFAYINGKTIFADEEDKK